MGSKMVCNFKYNPELVESMPGSSIQISVGKIRREGKCLLDDFPDGILIKLKEMGK
jgi:hypothetical protein